MKSTQAVLSECYLLEVDLGLGANEKGHLPVSISLRLGRVDYGSQDLGVWTGERQACGS